MAEPAPHHGVGVLLLWLSLCYLQMVGTCAERYVFEGDSTTAWDSTTGSSWVSDLPSFPYFQNLSLSNLAVDGSTSGSMLARYANVHALRPTNSQDLAVFAVRIGINDITTLVPWPTTWSNWNAEVSNAVADGFRVISYKVQSTKYLPLYPTFTSNRTALNAAMATNPYVWRSIDIANFGLTNYSNTNYFYDGLHPTALTDTLVASNFNRLILAATKPSINNIVPGSNGTMTLTVFSSPMVTNEVQWTTNLSNPVVWRTLATQLPQTNDLWKFTDTNAVSYPRQFYRVKLLEP